MPQKTSGSVLRFLILLLVVGAATWWGIYALQKTPEKGEAGADGSAKPPPSKVKVAAVISRKARQTHRVTGSLRAVNRAEVAAKEDGAIQEIFADEGDVVKAGQMLLRLDGRRLEAQLAQAKANITAARSLITQREAEVARSKTDLTMKEDLYKQKALSQSEALDAEREYKVALSLEKSSRDALSAANAALQLLDVRCTDLVIQAPFDARVVTRHVEPGEWLKAGDAVMTLVSDGKLEAWLQVPERFAGACISDDLTLQINGKSYLAKNTRAIPEADPASRVTMLLCDLGQVDAGVVPGLSVTAEIPVSEDQTYHVLPSDAVVTTYAGPAVYRAKPQDKGPPLAERVLVTIVFQNESESYLAPENLKEGDLIVIEGNERLFPMTPLAFELPDETPASAEQTPSQPDA